MMKKKFESPYRKIKFLLVLPVFAIVLNAFATTESAYTKSAGPGMGPVLSSGAFEKEAKGIVVDEEGKPLAGVKILVSNSINGAATDSKGRFSIKKIPDGSSMIFSLEGYKSYMLMPLISSNYALRITLVKDPDYKKPISLRTSDGSEVKAMIIVDGEVTENGLHKTDPNSILSVNVLKDEAAIKKYGDKGRDGVIEITTKDPKAQKEK